MAPGAMTTPHADRDFINPNAVNVPYRFLVPNAAAGLIVGKNGENIKQMTAQLSEGAKIDVSRDGELKNIEDKMVTVRAIDPAEKIKITRFILSKVRAALSIPKEQDCGLILVCPQSAIAPLIGPKGDKIREIIECSKVEKVDVPKTASFGTDYAIRIVGNEEATLDACSRVYAVVQEIANRSRLSERDFALKPLANQNGPNPLQMSLPIKFLLNKSEASWIVGRQGRVIRELRAHSGATLDLWDIDENRKVLEVGGLYQAKLTGINMVLKTLENCSGRASSTTVLVNVDYVGHLIGKGGASIQQIATEADCRTDIDKDPFPDEQGQDRKVVIRGGEEPTRKALQMVAVKLEEVQTDKRVAINLDPEQPVNLKVMLTKDEVGWCIGKGGHVMKEIRRQSGASTWIKEGDEAYPHFDRDNERVTEIVGRLEASLTCIELLIRAVDKFSKKQEGVVMLTPLHFVSRMNLEQVAETSKGKVTLGEQRGDYRLIHIAGHDEIARKAAYLICMRVAELAHRN
eukprot:GEMP01023537.1.p1 GENE.GEMP01023537.1~~GEMP01023537.1.p1  ORF type:complete len:517 (+),score=130.67 GEMP01023537.1:213-1763(+)